MKKKAENKGTKVIAGPVRLSYVHVFEKHSITGVESDAKYSAVLLIPKDDKEMVEAFTAAIEQAKTEGKATKWGGKMPANLSLPMRDGDEKDDPVFHGHYLINAKANTKPGVVDVYKKDITDPEAIYSGVWAYVSVNMFAFASAGNKGVACGLNNLMKAKDGEFLGGRSSAESDFADVEADVEDDDL